MNDEEFEETRQRLQIETTQKQTLQLQYNELKRTMEEVEKTNTDAELFQLSGQILIKKDKNDILKDLKEKSEIIDFRLKSSSKSIDELTKTLQEMQALWIDDSGQCLQFKFEGDINVKIQMFQLRGNGRFFRNRRHCKMPLLRRQGPDKKETGRWASCQG